MALTLTMRYNQDLADNTVTNLLTVPKQKAVVKEEPALLDIADWGTYKDKTYPLTFNYPKGWQVQSTPVNKNGFYDITIKPSDKSPNFHISISKQGFLGFDGLEQTPYKLGTVEGKSVNGNLIGLKVGENYYTFDSSLNAKKMPEFTTLMSTVLFQ